MVTRYRLQSEGNLYHITARGVAQQIIFEDDEDRCSFGKRMRTCLEDGDVELFAWCFMSNHVHLLLHGELENVTRFMRRLLIGYAKHFNARHGRVGSLFQDRFDSTAIESDEQLMTCVRYIHRNPSEIPGQSADRYEWSSYREYLGTPFISRTDFVMSLFNDLESFISFHDAWHPEPSDSEKRQAKRLVSDQEAVVIMQELLDIGDIVSIASLDKAQRNAKLAMLKRAGFPINQIARITGIGRNIVQRAK